MWTDLLVIGLYLAGMPAAQITYSEPNTTEHGRVYRAFPRWVRWLLVAIWPLLMGLCLIGIVNALTNKACDALGERWKRARVRR